MKLSSVKTFEDFAHFYHENGLVTTEEKINYLKQALDIIGICSEKKETPEEILLGLEDLALENPKYVELIQAEKWNGQLPATMIPNGALPILGK